MITNKDAMGWAKIGGMLGALGFTNELMRATFWCPPHPPEVEVTDDNTPYMQVYKKYQPDIWTPELRQMTTGAELLCPKVFAWRANSGLSFPQSLSGIQWLSVGQPRRPAWMPDRNV